MSQIAVLGSLNMDLTIRTPRLPLPGETVLGREFTTLPGGKGANQAVAAAKLGGDVAMIGRVGDDDFGRALRSALANSGVDHSHVVLDGVVPTGVAVITVQGGGQNTIVVAQGANGVVVRGDVDTAKDLITNAKILVTQLEIPLDTVTYALEIGRAAHVFNILNPAPAQALSKDVLALCDMIAPNETEASVLSGVEVIGWESAEAAAKELARRGVGTIVITLGARGALAWDGKKAIRVPGFVVDSIDATAAGDAFVGSLAVSHANGVDLPTALRIASAAGALTTTRLGAQNSIPTRADVDAFLSQQVA